MASHSALSLKIKQELTEIRLNSPRPAGVVEEIGAAVVTVDVVVDKVAAAVMVTRPTTVESGKEMKKLHRLSPL